MDQLTLRWKNRDHSLVPADPNEPFRWTPAWTVEEILEDAPARRFVERHHYAGTWVPARFRYGLYLHHELVGVAVFSHPQNDKALTNIWPSLDTWEACELGRLVLLDGTCPGNSESALVGEAFRRLRRDHMQAGVVSFSDPIPRARFARSVVLPGHVGIVYQSVSTLQGCARLVGRSAARIRRLLPDGTEIPPRGLTKIRKHETGGPTNIERLVAAEPGRGPHGVDQTLAPEGHDAAAASRQLQVRLGIRAGPHADAEPAGLPRARSRARPSTLGASSGLRARRRSPPRELAAALAAYFSEARCPAPLSTSTRCGL